MLQSIPWYQQNKRFFNKHIINIEKYLKTSKHSVTSLLNTEKIY